MSALVLGRGGLGAAFVSRLTQRGPVTVLSRQDGLDWEQPARAEAALLSAAAEGPFATIIDATGTLIWNGIGPEKRLGAIDPTAMAAQFAVNAMGPALVLKHYEKLMLPKERSVFATLSARVGSIGDNHLGGWISYRAAKAALNQIVRTASIEIARKRPEAIVVALHPGTVATGLSAPFAGSHDTFTPDVSVEKLLGVLDALRPDDTGHLYAYDGARIPW